MHCKILVQLWYVKIFRQGEKEKRDTRGRTPLMLAVTLGHLESARVLLRHLTNVNTENRDGWTGILCYVSFHSCLDFRFPNYLIYVLCLLVPSITLCVPYQLGLFSSYWPPTTTTFLRYFLKCSLSYSISPFKLQHSTEALDV